MGKMSEYYQLSVLPGYYASSQMTKKYSFRNLPNAY